MMRVIKSLFRPIFKDVGLRVSAIVSLLINASIWGLLLLHFQPSSEPVALHYNIYFSIDRFGLWYKALIIPAVGLLIVFGNFFVSTVFARKDETLIYLLFFSALFVNIILLVSSLLITTNL